ncbi:preprotein translocase subunit SecY [Candidatus Dependentiae bacterium]|nr:preprotein translocase subunit SecY [Candidatus Dependentiae bacterium]MBU4387598.1 preprotein translocase subunit SecY [Candidatus Dependentiae bacterium]MCG2756280.1 preprotein translocase subunit SecY [Candidatus Dependentiae bacterium]
MVVLLKNFKNIFLVPELRKKLAFTLGVLAVYRFGSHIPIPGVNINALQALINPKFAGGLLAYLDLFSGGALKQFAIFALGMIPYINASIMMQLLTIMLPSLEQLSKEGEYGRKIINQYTRYLALGLSVIQGFMLAIFIENQPGVVLNPGFAFKFTTVLILAVGALFIMWLGEQINAHGIGNGSSVIIFAGIVVNLPAAILKVLNLVKMGQTDPLIGLLLILVSVGIIGLIVFLEKGERRVAVQYAKRVVGNKVYGGQSSYIPFKINPSGVIPVIFASTLIQFPMMLFRAIASKFPAMTFLADWFNYNAPIYYVLQSGLIIFFAFFYTAIIFNPVELADNIRKSGGFIPGIRPGKQTSEFFDYLLTRIGLPGAIYLASLALVPNILQNIFNFPVMFSGISLLIVIGVAMDTSAQIEAYLIERRYEGFLASGRLKGRYGR